jgi:hypothetical protein
MLPLTASFGGALKRIGDEETKATCYLKKIKRRIKMKKAVIYTRDSNNHKENLEKQKQTCREYAEKNGYEIVGVFTDTTSTGLNKQPYFWLMLELAKHGDFKFVIVDSFDRVARRHILETRNRVMKSGLKIICPRLEKELELEFFKERWQGEINTAELLERLNKSGIKTQSEEEQVATVVREYNKMLTGTRVKTARAENKKRKATETARQG